MILTMTILISAVGRAISPATGANPGSKAAASTAWEKNKNTAKKAAVINANLKIFKFFLLGRGMDSSGHPTRASSRMTGRHKIIFLISTFLLKCG